METLQLERSQQQANDGAWSGYSPDQYRPLGAYAALVGVYNLSFAAMFVAARRRHGPVAPPIGGVDMLLLGVATHKLSRLVTKDLVTSVLRAPFTTYEGHGDAHGEVQESPRGHGMRYAIGELLTCPYCTAQWVAPALWLGCVVAPAPTRLLARVFSSVVVADALHLAYIKATKAASS